MGWFSSLFEAYNMAIYSFLAPFLAMRMFHAEPRSAIFFSYCLVLVASLIFYPAGALYYGMQGDKKGRRTICSNSTLGLATATGLIGLIPMDLLGDKTWVCFLFLICAQYFFSGGEYPGSTVFSLEHAREKRTGLISSISCLFAVCGLAAANGFATLSLLTQNESWVRGCFFVGAAGGLISYFLRQCEETPAYSALPQEFVKEVGLYTFVQKNWHKILGIALVFALFMVSYSFIFIFLPLVHESQGFATFQALIAYGTLLLVAGFIADKIGIHKIMEIGSFLFCISVLPLCYFCPNLLLLQLFLTALACFVIGPIHSWMLNQFEVHERCRGIFISSALAMSLFGGTTVPICLKLHEKFHTLQACAFYPLGIALMAFLYLACEEQEAEKEARSNLQLNDRDNTNIDQLRLARFE